MWVPYTTKLSCGKTFMVREENGYLQKKFMVACYKAYVADQQGHNFRGKSFMIEWKIWKYAPLMVLPYTVYIYAYMYMCMYACT